MRIFAIRDESDPSNTDIAYLFYYEHGNHFYIELPDDADPWHTPLILSSILERGARTVNSYWSRVWVQQRIVPRERQNIGQILKDNQLDAYDEFKLLLLSEGRCAQDDYYIAEIPSGDLPGGFAARFSRRLEDAVPLSGRTLLVFFRSGETKLCELTGILQSDRRFSPLLKNDAYFAAMDIQPGGYGISWDDELVITDSELYRIGQDIPLTQDDFASYVQMRIITTAEAADMLHCSKQNISDLIRRGKLHPVRETPKSRLFLKSEISKRLWK